MPSSACSVRFLCRDFLPAFVSAFLFCVASSGLIMLNKYIMSTLGFDLPMTLSLLGMLASFAVSFFACVVTGWVPRTVVLDKAFCLRRALPVRFRPHALPPPPAPQASRCCPASLILPPPSQIGVLTAGVLYFGNLAYVSLSVSFLQMLKASTPILVMALMYAAGLETPSTPLVLSVLVIALGTFVSALGEIRFAVGGVVAMTISQFCEASKLVRRARGGGIGVVWWLGGSYGGVL